MQSKKHPCRGNCCQRDYSQQDCHGWFARQIAPLKEPEANCRLREARAGAATSKYREYPPPVQLNGHLMCLSTQSISGSRSPYAHRVLPDGCVDIVFINDEPPLVVGPYVKCLIARLPPGAMIVGAGFLPGRAVGLLGHPASTLLNQSVPLDAVWNKSVCSQFMWEVSDQRRQNQCSRIGPDTPAAAGRPTGLGSHDSGRVAGRTS